MVIESTSHPGSRRRRLGLLICTLAGILVAAPAQGTPTDGDDWPRGWVVSPEVASNLADQGDVVLLDARSGEAYREGHVTGAVHVNWRDFAPVEASKRGALKEVPALERHLGALGVDFGKPVLVVGQSEGGWGEGGRIVWMLRTLGHPAASWVDGGHDALVAEGASISSESPEVRRRSVDVEMTDRWTASRSEVKAAMSEDEVVLLDTRHRREYEGSTPYGESRGGHIPSAVHLHFRDLLDDEGRMLPAPEIRDSLEKRGIDTSTRVIAYCTGGVRSALVTVVLSELGYEAKNYAGSMWEWSAQPEETFPLKQVE